MSVLNDSPGHCMLEYHIEQDFRTFLADGEEAFGAVRVVHPEGQRQLTIYVENAGDFVVPYSAIKDVHSDKVVFDINSLDANLQSAILNAHTAEQPN